jgi:hypothetical protein
MGMLTHRHMLYELLPTWLRNANAFRVLYAIALVADALGDALFAAIKIRFPGFYSNESLPLLGSDRRRARGPHESAESFANRLTKWWDSAKQTGDLLSVAREVADCFLPATPPVVIVTNNGTRYTLGADRSWSIDSVAWNWDGHTEQWSRFWVLLDNSAVQAIRTTLGISGASALVRDDFRRIGANVNDFDRCVRDAVERVRPPYNHCSGILVVLDAGGFWSAPPDGDWNYWANRNLNALYWEGTAL